MSNYQSIFFTQVEAVHSDNGGRKLEHQEENHWPQQAKGQTFLKIENTYTLVGFEPMEWKMLNALAGF